MDCSACHRQMNSVSVDGISVDTCRNGCGGLWFDRSELAKFDEPHEGGEQFLDIPLAEDIEVEASKTRFCPKCDEVILFKRFSSVKQAIEVDECLECGGIFLDAGELRLIRKEFSTAKDREQAAENYFRGLMGYMNFLHEEENRREEELRNTAETLGFVMSYLLPQYALPIATALGILENVDSVTAEK